MRVCAKRGRRRAQAGLGLVEVVLLIGVIATALAAGLPAFFHALRLSKISEASEQLSQLQKGVAAYYAARHQTDQGIASRCLPDAAGPTPEEPSVEPLETDFADPKLAGSESWRAVGFTPALALRFSYTLSPSAPGCAETTGPDEGRSIVLRAEGDLDGDGHRSLFERNLQTTAAGLAVEPLLITNDRTE